jgi:hypothetical protein
LGLLASNAKVGEAAVPDSEVTRSGEPNRQPDMMGEAGVGPQNEIMPEELVDTSRTIEILGKRGK